MNDSVAVNMGSFNMIGVLVAVCCLVTVSAVEYSKADEGYPIGFLTRCPGSWKPAVISPDKLGTIFISVLGPGNFLQAKWTPYNYYKIGNLHKHPEMDFSKKTFMYVGGYLDGTTLPIGRLLGQLYRERGYNVLIMDALEVIARDFPVAVRFTRPIGYAVAEMLANLTAQGLDPKKLELVGLSLGGQIMSFIAKSYYKITGTKISSLTGLDPTGPCFRQLGPDQRLDPSDADFVLVVATNIDGFGIASPVGHVMFYVNGGEFQPGDVWYLPCTVECSHVKSYFYWVSALINPGSFIGIKCNSVQQARESNCYDNKPMVTNTLDLYTDRSKPGIYFLATFNRYPYSLGKKGLKRKYDQVNNHLRMLNDKQVLRV